MNAEKLLQLSWVLLLNFTNVDDDSNKATE